MLSTFPATFSADSFIGNPFPLFEPGFPAWEFHEPASLFPPQFPLEPVSSNSGSETQNPSPSSGSDDSNRNESKTLTSGSDEPPNRNNLKTKRGCDVEERKRRRMISNRESARRSRMRKQSHLENMRSQANRLKTGNREQMNRLRMVVHQTQIFRRDNEQLRAEAVMLRQRLWDIRQVLVVRQLQQLLNPTAMSMGMH